ncbi:MAG: tetratricopeptide repeat protein, partial [Pseudomonadales bacterium]|nr:tetratricopeptide repeat protein [Pseudomonadales bacterium]
MVKKLLVFVGILWVLPLVLTGLPQTVVTGGAAMAAEDENDERKTRQVPAMRERTYKTLAEAQLMIDPESVPVEEGEERPEPKGTPRDAVDMLLKLLDRRGLNSYEKAQVWNTLAFAYYTLEDIPKTIDAYEQILQQGEITYALELSTLRALFQLYYAQEKYRKSLEFIDKWQELKGDPDPDVNFIKATAYYQLEEFRNALNAALRVEEIAKAQDRTIKENWWYLQVVLYNELGDIDNVIRVLEKLVVKYPKKQYWMHLASMYSEKGRDDKALSAYYAAYTQGLFTRE